MSRSIRVCDALETYHHHEAGKYSMAELVHPDGWKLRVAFTDKGFNLNCENGFIRVLPRAGNSVDFEFDK